MPLDAWRRAHDREVRARAQSEYAAEGKSSYPRVWLEAELKPRGHLSDDVPDEGTRRRAVWAVVDPRGGIVRVYSYSARAAARRFAMSVAAPKLAVVLAKWAIPEE